MVSDNDSSVMNLKCTCEFALIASVNFASVVPHMHEHVGFNTFNLCKTSSRSHHINRIMKAPQGRMVRGQE